MKNRKIKLITAALIVAILCPLLLTSCPDPLETDILTILKDADAPTIIITSPEDYGEYATVLELAGYIEDDSIGSLPEGTTITVSYSISGTSVSGTADVSITDGTFSATIDVSDVSGDKVIELSAADSNGNTGATTVNICKPDDGGDISGYSLTPGNKQVTISWDAVPNAESYSIDLYYYSQTVEITDSSTTSYTWTGLSNGEEYTFQLTAIIPDDIGENAVSSEKSTLPLSTRSFAPWVKKTDYKTITIEWKENTYVDAYLIERSLSPNDSWEVIQQTSDNEYVDDSLDVETSYYYRVTPSNYDEITSDYIAAEPGAFKLAEVGFCDTRWADDVTVIGDYVYVADDLDGLKIYDISDLDSPVLTGSCDTPDRAYGVAVSGDYAYIADDSAGLQIINIDPQSDDYCTITGSLNHGYSFVDVAVSGDYSYVASKSSGLKIIDINPESDTYCTISTSYDTAGYVYGVTVSGDYAYFTDTSSGVQIIDIDPESDDYREIVGTCNMPGYTYGIAVSDNTAYVADYASGMQIIDIDPESGTYCTIIGNCDTDGNARGVDVSGDYAYIADHTSGLQIIDINTESDTYCTVLYNFPFSDVRRVFTSGDYAYVAATTSGVQIIQNAAPYFPKLESSCDITGVSTSVTVSGDYTYVAEWSFTYSHLHIIDRINPSNEYFYDTTSASAVAVAGSHAYIVDSADGLLIIDCEDPSAPSLKGSYTGASSPVGIAVAGDYAYVADSTEGLLIIDISDPSNPLLEGICATSGNAYRITVAGDYAYVADYDAGLQIIDCSNKSSPSITGNYNTDDYAWDVDVSGDYAYVAYGTSGLHIIDCSSPSNPSLKGSCAIDNAINVIVSGDYAFVAETDSTDSSLQIIDISDSSEPSAIGSYDYSSGNEYGWIGLDVVGPYAYFIDLNEHNLDIINLLGE